jgi:hypothetical protein
MKFELGPLENSRTFYLPKGNQTIIRDVVVNQTPPPEPIKEVVEEVIQEIVEPIIEEPKIEEQPTTPKTKRNKQ